MTCSKEKDARVPWKYVVEEPDTFVDAKYLPDGVKLKDTEKLVAVEVDALLNHWRRRQQRPSEGPVFLFRRYRMKDGTLGVPDSSYTKMKGAKGKGKEAPKPPKKPVPVPPKPDLKSKGKGKGKGKTKKEESESSAEASDKDKEDEEDSDFSKKDRSGADESSEESPAPSGNGDEDEEGQDGLKKQRKGKKAPGKPPQVSSLPGRAVRMCLDVMMRQTNTSKVKPPPVKLGPPKASGSGKAKEVDDEGDGRLEDDSADPQVGQVCLGADVRNVNSQSVGRLHRRMLPPR